MLYILPIIYFLMVYGAMYEVPKYIPAPPAKENAIKEAPLSSPNKKDANQEIPSEPIPVPEIAPPAVPAAGEPQTLPEQVPSLDTENATKENSVNGSSLPASDKKDVTQEIPSEPIPVPEIAPPPVPVASEPQTLPEQVPSLDAESATKENSVSGASLPSPDKKDANQEIPSEPIPVPEIAPPPVPAASDAQTLPEQVPSLDAESSTKETAIEGASLPSPVKDTNQAMPIPSEPEPVSNIEVAPTPATSEPYSLPKQTPPLSTESAAQVAPAQSESSVPQQNNEPSYVPASPEQEPAPIRLEDLP